jgi:hypothetical protein
MPTAPRTRTRFYFFLNPYADMAFTRCPKCEARTKQRKLPLAIHIEPRTFCVLNKTCRFCPGCELVIARQSEREALLISVFEDQRTRIEPGDYLVIGTLDRADWRVGRKEEWSPSEGFDRVWVFKDRWHFEVQGGWGPA